VNQHESFPGRPRGRRARHDDGESGWQGYDAASSDQREFPDLDPIRPRGARERDMRAYGQSDQPVQQGGVGSYPGNAGAGYPAGGQGQAGSGYSGGQYAGGGYQDGGYGRHGQGQAAPAEQTWAAQASQAPWADQQAPAPQYQAPQQAAPNQAAPKQAPPKQAPPRPKGQRKQQEDEAPSWAEPDSVEEFSERWRRRGREARREEQQAGQRKRRRLLIAGGAVVAVAIAVTIYLVSGGPGAASLGFGGFVDNFLPGELQQVPNPCTAVPTATLNQYLPGKTKQAAPPLNSGQSTECSWTLDNPPTYRVLDVQFQAYSPSGLASGNGSATFAAEDAFASFEDGYAKPGKQTGLESSKVTDLSGMSGGTDTSAFQATEVFDRGGAIQDLAYDYVRYRNVIIRVMVQGLDQSTGSKTYSVQMSDLTTAANTVAKEMASQIAK
jgi:hypothetical protein